jgi:uncharacterized low-complexity protein
MTKKTITPAAIVGAALVGGLSAVNIASAADNPFALKPLDSGYMQLAEGDSGKGTGEGKCGSKTEGEGKCGSKSGGEGKCGEGKCGGKT